MTVDLQQIDLMACPFTWGGKKICYLSRGKLRVIAKQLGLSPDGVKIDIYNRIVMNLEQNGAKAEISKRANHVTNF